MDDRRKMLLQLDELEQEMRKLEISYDQYFSGIEKREPMKQRDALARRIRRLTSRHVVQTDVRFRLQGLATRFHTYANYWDRILRLMDEGKYKRGSGRIPPPATARPAAPATASDPAERVYRELVAAYEQLGSSRIPTREQVQDLLERQKEKIRRKFGEHDIDFVVVTDGGKPKLKVRAKRTT